MNEKNILITYFSRKGSTAELAEEIRLVLQEKQRTNITVTPVDQVEASHILNCDALIIGSPCCFDSYAGIVKDLFERVYEELEGKINHKPVCIFIAAGENGMPAFIMLRSLLEKIEFNVFGEPILRNANDETEKWKRACQQTINSFILMLNETDKSM